MHGLIKKSAMSRTLTKKRKGVMYEEDCDQ